MLHKTSGGKFNRRDTRSNTIPSTDGALEPDVCADLFTPRNVGVELMAANRFKRVEPPMTRSLRAGCCSSRATVERVELGDTCVLLLDVDVVVVVVVVVGTLTPSARSRSS